MLNLAKALGWGFLRPFAERSAALRARVFPPLVRLKNEEAGSYLVTMTVVLPVLIGFAGLGAEAGLLLYDQQTLQGAADSAAVSTARDYGISASTNCGAGGASDPCLVQAEAITGQYAQNGFVNGSNGVAVTVNRPPQSGSHTADSDAIEVIVTQPQARFFSSYWGSQAFNVTGRAVAMLDGGNCILALGSQNLNAITVSGGSPVTLSNCGLFSDSDNNSGGGNDSIVVSGGSTISALSVGTMGGVNAPSGSITPAPKTDVSVPVSNPYAYVPLPSSTTNPSALGPPYAPSGATSAATAPGGTVLTFASTPSGVVAGMPVQDISTTNYSPTWTATGITCNSSNNCNYVIPLSDTVASPTVTAVTATTVTLSTPVVASSQSAANGKAKLATAPGGTTLTFNNTPNGPNNTSVVGMVVTDIQAGHTGTIPANTTVVSVTSTTVTLSSAVVSPGVAANDSIQFFPGVLSGDTIQFGCQPGTWLSENTTISVSTTLSPGTYCGGINFSSGTTITFNPGTYIFPGGSASQKGLNTGGATVTGAGGATLVFTCPTSGSCAASSQNATASFSGGSIVNLTAPTSGTYEGIVIYGDATMPVGTQFSISGGSSGAFDGAIDLPNAALTYSGGSSSGSACTQIIADTVTISGGASFGNGCNNGTVPIGGTPQLVE